MWLCVYYICRFCLGVENKELYTGSITTKYILSIIIEEFHKLVDKFYK